MAIVNWSIKRIRYFYVIIIVIGCVSCTIHNTSNNHTLKHDSVTNKTNGSIEKFTKYVLKDTSKGILQITFIDDTLSVVSQGNWVTSPFGTGNTPSSIMRKFPGVFKLDKAIVIDKFTKDSVSYALIGKSSYINLVKLKQNETKDNLSSDSVVILNAEVRDHIKIAYDIVVGMKKEDFFRKVFGYYDDTLLRSVNVVVNSDPAGEDLSTYFLFNNHELQDIIMKSPMQ